MRFNERLFFGWPQVYFCLFKLLRKCIMQMTKPVVEGPLGSPPFEQLSISKGVTNFVIHQYGQLPPKVRTWIGLVR